VSPLSALDAGAGAAAALANLGASFPTGRTTTQKVSRELETVFLTQLLQTMRKTVPQSDFLPKSPERDVYDGMFDRTMAETIAQQDPLGFDRSLKVSGTPADSPNASSGSRGGKGLP
jgi:Rod binding domain-containing protein